MKKIALCLLFGLYLFSISVTAQKTKTENSEFVPLEKVVQTDGWSIPDLSKEKIEDQAIVQIDQFAVKKVLYYVLESEILYNFDYYYINQTDKSLKVETRECDLRNIISHSVKDKIFAYSFTCVPFADRRIDESGKMVKTKAYIGILMSFHYFDEDGDGKFETKYITHRIPTNIPQWIKNLK